MVQLTRRRRLNARTKDTFAGGHCTTTPLPATVRDSGPGCGALGSVRGSTWLCKGSACALAILDLEGTKLNLAKVQALTPARAHLHSCRVDTQKACSLLR